MKVDSQEYKYSEMTDKIIKAFYIVYNFLGYGFLEKVYENALLIELEKEGLSAVSQASIKVLYENQVVGEYFADILVESAIIVEIKAAKCFTEEHEAQVLNYLKATEIEVGLLLNFGIKPGVKRKAFNNQRKNQRGSA